MQGKAFTGIRYEAKGASPPAAGYVMIRYEARCSPVRTSLRGAHGGVNVAICAVTGRRSAVPYEATIVPRRRCCCSRRSQYPIRLIYREARSQVAFGDICPVTAPAVRYVQDQGCCHTIRYVQGVVVIHFARLEVQRCCLPGRRSFRRYMAIARRVDNLPGTCSRRRYALML